MKAMEEKRPDAIKLVDGITRSKGWSPVYRKQLEELLISPSLRCALHHLLDMSDEMLRNIGASDLTNELALKNGLRTQGIAAGLVQAVEVLCELATADEQAQEETSDELE